LDRWKEADAEAYKENEEQRKRLIYWRRFLSPSYTKDEFYR